MAANAVPPAIVTMSLGVARGQWSQALELTTRSLIRDLNITVIVASGNTQTNSCNIVPGRSPIACLRPGAVGSTPHITSASVVSWRRRSKHDLSVGTSSPSEWC